MNLMRDPKLNQRTRILPVVFAVHRWAKYTIVGRATSVPASKTLSSVSIAISNTVVYATWKLGQYSKSTTDQVLHGHVYGATRIGKSYELSTTLRIVNCQFFGDCSYV